MQLNSSYTKREKGLWDAACAFATLVNAKLDSDSTLMLRFGDSILDPNIRLEFIEMKETDGTVYDYWICYKEGRCTQGIFSINEDCSKTKKQVIQEMKDCLKIYKEVEF